VRRTDTDLLFPVFLSARVKKEPENQCGARFSGLEVAEGHTILSRAGGPD